MTKMTTLNSCKIQYCAKCFILGRHVFILTYGRTSTEDMYNIIVFVRGRENSEIARAEIRVCMLILVKLV